MEPLALSPTDAAKALSVGRTTLYRLIQDGKLKTTKIGTRTLILTESLRKLAAEGTEARTDGR